MLTQTMAQSRFRMLDEGEIEAVSGGYVLDAWSQSGNIFGYDYSFSIGSAGFFGYDDGGGWDVVAQWRPYQNDSYSLIDLGFSSGANLGSSGDAGGTSSQAPAEPENEHSLVCAFVIGAEGAGNTFMASGATVAAIGLLDGPIPDGEVLGAAIAGVGGIGYLAGATVRAVNFLAGGTCP